MRSELRSLAPRAAVAAVADFALSLSLLAAGMRLPLAAVCGFGAGLLLAPARSRRIGREIALGLTVLALRGILLEVLTDRLQLAGGAALAAAALFASVSLAAARALFVREEAEGRDGDRPAWILAVLLASLCLRVLVLPALDLLPEEAYYWQYGQHPALGYLDHPPMVAWLSRLFTGVLGRHEAALRAPAFLSFVLGTGFLFALTRELFGRAAAIRAVVLCAVLPFFFSVGVLFTPDAPLFPCWAGALFFLWRAVSKGEGRHWIGVGVCLGLGMLSKYTIALLVPSAVVYCAIDPRARMWFRRPHPYLALLIAALLFSPVIWWNAENGWASFAFQGSRRWSASGSFHLHTLLGSALLLLTPTGFLAAVAILRKAPPPEAAGDSPSRYRAFAAVFVLVPLSVFVVFSISHAPKLNWTGPVWLAAVPGMAAAMRSSAGFVRKAWAPTAAVTLATLACGVWYIMLGLPGAPPLRWMAVPAAWRELVRGVDDLSEDVRAETGERPVRAGLDLYFLAAEISFYSRDRRSEDLTGRHVTGRDSLMWSRWAPADPLVGRTLLLVARNRRDLEKPPLPQLFDRLSPVRELPIRRGGKIVTLLPWRVGYGYRGPP